MWACQRHALSHVVPAQVRCQASNSTLLVAWLAGVPGADVALGLAALMNAVTNHPGSSWRVGVGAVTADEQAKLQEAAAAAAAAAAAEKLILLRQGNTKSKCKPAVMTVGGRAGVGACGRRFSAVAATPTTPHWH